MRHLSPLILLAVAATVVADAPTDDPAAAFGAEWTGDLPWDRVVSVADIEGPTPDARFAAARKRLDARGGGVVYFPPGEYRFTDDIVLADGIVIRGADPARVTDARKEGYAPPTRFVFPKYKPRFEGKGTPISTAFKGIRLADPAGGSNCGVVNVAMRYGHVELGQGDGRAAGHNRLVVGCVLTSAARPAPHVPDVEMGQHAWQRFTARHKAAVHVYAGENALVANNRLARSADDNFLQKGYRIRGHGRGKQTREMYAPERGVWFDYDNRPGISLNNYVLGGGGGRDPKGTPETHPWGFRKGLRIVRNFIWSTGRNAIAFSGDGTVCSDNVVRFPENLRRYTHTGRHQASGSSTNSNRAIQARGWRWRIENNDYLVWSNLVGDTSYRINDGEGIMHEGHANSIIRDSRLVGNRGNAYLSMYKTAGVDGLLVRGNHVTTPGGIPAIYVNSDRNWDRHVCRNVRIIDNVTAGSGILVSGTPAEGNVIRGNRHEGNGGKIINRADAGVADNTGYDLVESEATDAPSTK